MQEQGKVVKTEGNIVFIELEKRAACGYCHACDFQQNGNILKVVNDKQAKVGNKVVISIPEWNMIKIAFLVYIVPLVLFVAAYLAGDGIARNFSTSTDQFIIWGMITSIAVLFLYYLFIKFYDKQYKNSLKGKPQVVSIL
ncbi:SoxR reducing system RseC family protein [Candidatus Margulisiibacteriota bacterium]